MNSYDLRLKRTFDAVHMEPVDKTPFSYSGPAYLSREQGLPLCEFVKDFPKAVDADVGFLKAHPGIDSIHSPIMNPRALSMLWLSEAKLPGEELPDDELWQVDEKELITRDDYQEILKIGYGPWLQKFLVEKLGDPASKLGPFLQYGNTARDRLKDEAGVPVINSISYASPIEGFCGGRTLIEFFIDMYEEPELVKQVFDNAHAFLLQSFKAKLEAMKPLGCWIGGWRGAPELISHEHWMEFVWPYFKEGVLAAIERGVLPILHMDSKWDREFETLLDLPARKFLVMLDGASNMRLARNVLGDHACIMGDVPSRMLAYSSADEVHSYVKSLIEDCGPKTGVIIGSGCDVPFNAKPENVAAMIEATQG